MLFLTAYFICLTLGASYFLIKDVFLIVTAGTIGLDSLTSGGAGSFHIAIKLAYFRNFVSMGKDETLGEEIGLTYAILSHTTQSICILIMGLISIPILMRRKKKINPYASLHLVTISCNRKFSKYYF